MSPPRSRRCRRLASYGLLAFASYGLLALASYGLLALVVRRSDCKLGFEALIAYSDSLL